MPLKDDVSWVLSVCTHSYTKKKTLLTDETTASTEHYMPTL